MVEHYNIKYEKLEKTYKTTNIDDIIIETETIIYTPNDKADAVLINKKLKPF